MFNCLANIYYLLYFSLFPNVRQGTLKISMAAFKIKFYQNIELLRKVVMYRKRGRLFFLITKNNGYFTRLGKIIKLLSLKHVHA